MVRRGEVGCRRSRGWRMGDDDLLPGSFQRKEEVTWGEEEMRLTF